MKCTKCGSEISNDSKFCPKCGEKIVQPCFENENRIPEINTSVDDDKIEHFFKTHKTQLILIAAGVLFLILAINAMVNRVTTININDYVHVSAKGYDGYGDVFPGIDFNSLFEEYSEEMKQNNNSDRTYRISDLIYCYPEEYERGSLSNGDIIKIIVACDEETISKNFKLKLECTSFDYEIRDLTEPEYKDPFDDLIINFSGISPHGTLEYTCNEKEYSSLFHYDFSKTEDLSNNEVVTINIDYNWGYDDDTLLNTFGVVLKEKEKDYIVSGLSECLRDTSFIDPDIFQEMKDLAAEYFTNYNESLDKSISTPLGISYVGSLVAVPNSNRKYDNRVYLVYRLDRNFNFDWQHGDRYHTGTVDENRSFFSYICYDNVIFDENGNIDIDTHDFKVCKDKNDIRCDYNTNYFIWGEEIIGHKNLHICGFETYEELWTAQYDYMNGGEMYSCD